MEQIPILWGEKTVGELRTETKGLYTTLDARCTLPDDGLWCVWAVGDREELRVGVAEPGDGCATIVRHFSRQQLEPLGVLHAAFLRPAGDRQLSVQWRPLDRPERWFRTSWLRGQLDQLQGVRVAQTAKITRLAIPWDSNRPFPLTRLFCLATLRQLEGQPCLIFTFDREETPIFDGLEA